MVTRCGLGTVIIGPSDLVFGSNVWRPLARFARTCQVGRARKGERMTNSVAIWLGLLILIALVVDLVFDYGATLFLARQFLALIEWVAFWR